MMKGKKIAVAMSGGVDSTVTAALMKNAGNKVQGFFMALGQPDLAEQIARVQKSADFLDIPLEVIDLVDDFEDNVLKYFEESYVNGLTPNPCVICNKTVKCGRLLEQAPALGCDKMATGHYARIREKDGVFYLLKGKDLKKDQSYFLNQLTQKELQRLLFPLGDKNKEEVYAIAQDLGFDFQRSEESQDICFLTESVGDFLEKRTIELAGEGDIITLDGTKIGIHQGIHHFTVGQRRGLGIPDATPYYVVDLQPETNAVVVGKEEDLWRYECFVEQMNWTAGEKPRFPAAFEVKIRYRHRAAPARVEVYGDNGVKITFAERQRAITRGQFAVLYTDDQVVGGGRII